jgi:hypothetical protein
MLTQNVLRKDSHIADDKSCANFRAVRTLGAAAIRLTMTPDVVHRRPSA